MTSDEIKCARCLYFKEFIPARGFCIKNNQHVKVYEKCEQFKDLREATNDQRRNKTNQQRKTDNKNL